MTAATGFGTSGFGTGPYGSGTPLSTTGRAGTMLTDDRGAAQGSLYVDPRTRSWKFDANGRRVGMSNVEHLLIWRLTTVKNSSAWVGGGLEEASPGGISDDFAAQTDARVRAACKDIVDEGLLVIRSVTVAREGSRAQVSVLWDDLTTNETGRRVEV